MSKELVRGDELGAAICQAVEIDPSVVRRTIVDCEVGCVAIVYVELYAGDKILSLDWGEDLKGAKITILDKQKETATEEPNG